MNKHPIPLLYLVSSLFIGVGCSDSKNTITVSADFENEKIQFAVDELEAVLLEQGIALQKADSEKADIVFTL
jgi:uncharacterized protein YabE (DUF348 family)